MKITIKKGDVILLLIVILMAAFSFFLISMMGQGDRVQITVQGKVTDYPMSEYREIKLGDGEASFNTVVIEDGFVYMKNASCPDQICVHHKKINKDGETIICLPNKVYISVRSDKKSEVDN